MNGKGIIYDKDGNIEYEGSFRDNKKIVFYENGEYYTGDIVNNIREGNGKYYYISRNLKIDLNINDFDSKGNEIPTYKKINYYYIGEFKNNLRHGKGAIYIYIQIRSLNMKEILKMIGQKEMENFIGEMVILILVNLKMV